MSVNYTPKTWTGSLVTVADLNAEIRDLANGLQAAWTTFPVTWTAATTQPVLGNGTSVGRYLRVGKTIHFLIEITAGSTTTFGSGSWSLALPVGESARRWSFNGIARDTSAPDSHPIIAERTGSGVLSLRGWPATAGAGFRSVSSTVPFAWATGDSLTVNGTYEAA